MNRRTGRILVYLYIAFCIFNVKLSIHGCVLKALFLFNFQANSIIYMVLLARTVMCKLINMPTSHISFRNRLQQVTQSDHYHYDNVSNTRVFIREVKFVKLLTVMYRKLSKYFGYACGWLINAVYKHLV